MKMPIRALVLCFTVVSLSTETARATTVTILDPMIAVDDPVSMTVGADGRAWIAYYASVTGDLKLAHCANVACTSASVTTVDGTGDVGRAPALALGPDGRPVIAYADDTTPALKIAHCDDDACTTATRSVVDHVTVGETAIAIGADGLPLVAYRSFGSLKAAHCSVPDCTLRTVSALGTSNGLGVALAITEGLGLIVQGKNPAGGLGVRRCIDLACSATAPATLPIDRTLGVLVFTVHHPALTVPPDGRPLVSYRVEVTKGGAPFSNSLQLVRCVDASCSGQTGSQSFPSPSTSRATVAVQPNGLGWFAFTGSVTRLRACTDAECTRYTESCAILQATSLSLAAAGDGRSLLAYRRNDGAVGVAHDVDGAACAPPALTVENASAGEGTAAMSVPVRLSEPAFVPVVVSFSTADGTAGGADYVPTNTIVTIPAGQTVAVVPVPLLDDAIDESDEAFGISLSNPVNAVIASGSATGTIVDDDTARLEAPDAFTLEGASGTHDAAVDVRFVSGSSTATVTVAYETFALTATPGTDYVSVTGTLTFPPGATLRQAAIPVVGDGTIELDETFGVRLLNPVNADLDDAESVVTIQDDDAPSLSSIELTHGTSLTADLAAQPGPTPDVDHYRLSQSPRASYEVTADAVSGDLAPGLVVELLAEDNATVLHSSAPVGTGGAVALRWEHALDTTHTSQTVRVRSGSCGTACGTDDAYRLRLRETTGAVARFNNSATQATVLVLQNTTGQPLSVHAHFWSVGGQRIATTDNGPLPPHGVTVLNTGSVAALAGRSGTITVSHDGPYGALAGKAVAIEPATGFAFDTPLENRPR